MLALRFEAPNSIDEAVALLSKADGEARVLGGGTDLVVQMRSGVAKPGLVVDVKRIPEMAKIVRDAGGFRIGAAVPCAALGEHAELKAAWPGVVEAARLIGSTQIQGRATLGGNLCNASPAADSVPAMIAAGAICVIAGPKGRRELPVEALATAPGKTSLARGELVIEVRLAAQAARSSDAYLRFIPRTDMDIAVVGVGISLTLDAKGVCTAARVALGAVAPRAMLVAEAGAALVGSSFDAATLDRLAKAASAACRPIDDKRGTIEYRTKVAGVLARRTALIARDRAGSSR